MTIPLESEPLTWFHAWDDLTNLILLNIIFFSWFKEIMLLYSRKLLREKTSQISKKWPFCGRKVLQNATTYPWCVRHTQISWRIKTFVGGSKTAEFVNVFSLESFPLWYILTTPAVEYNISCIMQLNSIALVIGLQYYCSWRFHISRHIVQRMITFSSR